MRQHCCGSLASSPRSSSWFLRGILHGGEGKREEGRGKKGRGRGREETGRRKEGNSWYRAADRGVARNLFWGIKFFGEV